MTQLFIALVLGIILLGASLKLEAQTTGKGSRAYNKLKYIGGSSALMAVIGFVIIGAIM